jgi:hypothetical protein
MIFGARSAVVLAALGGFPTAERLQAASFARGVRDAGIEGAFGVRLAMLQRPTRFGKLLRTKSAARKILPIDMGLLEAISIAIYRIA